MQDQSQDFEKLRQLLALKRHETPPPGYFQDFSRGVIRQLEIASARRDEGWWARLLGAFQARPAISWSFCMATGLVLVAATTLFEGDPGQSTAGAQPGLPIASMTERPAATPVAGSFLITNLEPRQFSLDMAPPQLAAGNSNSLFSVPFYQRGDASPRVQGDQLPVKFERLLEP